jgi:hypothetical protein
VGRHPRRQELGRRRGDIDDLDRARTGVEQGQREVGEAANADLAELAVVGDRGAQRPPPRPSPVTFRSTAGLNGFVVVIWIVPVSLFPGVVGANSTSTGEARRLRSQIDYCTLRTVRSGLRDTAGRASYQPTASQKWAVLARTIIWDGAPLTTVRIGSLMKPLATFHGSG